MAARIKKDDLVMIRSGAFKGRTGKVLEVRRDEDRVLVEGINKVWKHIKPSEKNRKGGRIQKEAPIQMCKVQPVDPSTGKGTRVKFTVADGVKRRVAAKTGSDLGVVGKA